jgi:sphingomyelin phosphodiesterase acid-like 3
MIPCPLFLLWEALLLACLVLEVASSDDKIGKFLWLSDVHLEPFYGQPQGLMYKGTNATCNQNASLVSKPYGQFGCDAPKKLIQSAFAAQQQFVSNGDLDFVLVTGDFVRHGNDLLENPIQDTQAILSIMSQMLQSTYPNISIIPSFGNNDVTPGYYLDLESPTPLLEMLTNGFAKLLRDDVEVATFSQGGYLARNVTETITILSLNTVMYSTKHQPDQTYMQDPLGQFDWFEGQLQLAQSAGRVVYVVGHISPTVGSFHHSQLWHDQYLERYFSILKNYREIVLGQLFGHVHSGEFRLLHHPQEKTIQYPMLLSTSLSPIYGDNPSFRVFQYKEDSGLILDYNTYYLDLASQGPNWSQAKSFREKYQVPDMSTSSLETIIQTLMSSPQKGSLWDVFLSRKSAYSTISETSCDEECRHEWICTFQSMTKNDYNACVRGATTTPVGDDVPRPVWNIVLAGLLIAVVGEVLLVATKRYMERRLYHSHLQGQEADDHKDDSRINHENEIVDYQNSSGDGNNVVGGDPTKPPEIT